MYGNKLKRAVSMLWNGRCDIINFVEVTDENSITKNIKSITEGDISVTYSDGEGSLSRYEKLIDSLLNRKSELIKYRKLRW